MPVTSYHTIDGQVIGETTGGTRTGYLPDALGSVTATVDEAGAIVNTYRYKPYGEALSTIGGGATPRFLWAGLKAVSTTELDGANLIWRTDFASSVTAYSHNQSDSGVKNPSLFENIGTLLPDLSKGQAVSWCTVFIGASPSATQENKDCGHKRYRILFRFPYGPGLNLFPGWIIQRVKYTPNVVNCKTGVKVGSESEFWEAWYVDTNGRLKYSPNGGYLCSNPAWGQAYPAHDQFQLPPMGLCTVGKQVINGYPKYFKGLTEADIRGLGFSQGGGSATFGLYTAAKKPDNWKDAPASRHFLETKWDCCGIKKDELGCGNFEQDCKVVTPTSYDYGIYKENCGVPCR